MGQYTPSHPDDVRAQLAELRVRYRRELPEKVQAVTRAAAAVRGTGREELEAVHLLAHRLVGSAAIYGFGAVSQAAAELERFVVDAIEAPAPPSRESRQRLETLVAELESAAAEAG
jgi:HPt (histidine-containing phosphotransfer) domain-containing protein